MLVKELALGLTLVRVVALMPAGGCFLCLGTDTTSGSSGPSFKCSRTRPSSLMAVCLQETTGAQLQVLESCCKASYLQAMHASSTGWIQRAPWYEIIQRGHACQRWMMQLLSPCGRVHSVSHLHRIEALSKTCKGLR